LPEIHVFVGETNSGFSVVRREDACAIKLDFRMAMVLTLSQFFDYAGCENDNFEFGTPSLSDP
jgi:hypothetical protein